MTRKEYGVPAKSAIRALLILEYFEQQRTALSLKAIADHFELAASSASALLKNLASLDYLSYDQESRTYLPTLRLSRLGGWFEERILEDGVADLVRNIQERTQETILITTMNDLYIDFMYFQGQSDYVGAPYSSENELRHPRGGASVTCPFAWCLIKDFPVPRLESLYLRSKIKGLFDPSHLALPEFLKQVERTRHSRFIAVKPWPFPDTAVIATVLPVRPFGRRVALGIGGSERRILGNLSKLIDIVDEEFARFSPEGLDKEASGEWIDRATRIDVRAPLFLSPNDVPEYSGDHINPLDSMV